MAQSVLLIIGGGIAAYKSLELTRLLKGQGLGVRVILTKAAEEFITPLSVGSLSGEKVHTHLFNLTDEIEMGHIELSRVADLIVVAPATADLMAKMAHGLANDLASTALLATDKPVLIAPAMNVRMWHHLATQRNVKTLIGDGITLVGPNEGAMACGEFGLGRMAEPAEILQAILEKLAPKKSQPLLGKRVLITAGPTREAIDPVRYISNHSSGKQGYAIAAAAVRLGAETILISGPTNLTPPQGVQFIAVESAREMLAAAKAALPADLAVFTAAVADWRVENQNSEKTKKRVDGTLPQLALVENPDILQTIAQHKTLRPKFVVGFAAETEDVLLHAKAKLAKKSCDLIVANDVSAENNIFGGDQNRVHLISAAGAEEWPSLSKTEVARRLMDRLVTLL